MAAEQKATYCRICEPLCGMVATVEDGRLVPLRPDKDHPLSQGFACPKGIAFDQVQNDPDRVTHPLRRAADGVRAGLLGEAMADIADRLRRSSPQHGPRRSAGTGATRARSATRTRCGSRPS